MPPRCAALTGQTKANNKHICTKLSGALFCYIYRNQLQETYIVLIEIYYNRLPQATRIDNMMN